jgi:hypothetical protein
MPMHARAIATEIGDALKYDAVLKEIDRTAKSLFPQGCVRKSFPNDAITSQRALGIYEWVLSLDDYSIPNAQKELLVVEFVKRITPDSLTAKVEKILLRNGISANLVSGLAFQELTCPDITKFTVSMPKLQKIIEDRWYEAQRCQRAEAYLSCVILMGSILEALLLSRCHMDRPTSYKSLRAPRDKNSSVIQLQDWKLNALIEVCADVGWIKLDRSKFSHALRESRNIVHPWEHAASANADFDDATCKTSWQVLVAAIQDLNKSLT